jgi:hypothetical protein
MPNMVRNLARAAAYVGLLTGLLWCSPAHSDEIKLPLSLPGGGQVVAKKETQKRTPNCRAQRTWVEVEGLPEAEAAKHINGQIRKKITVGRKLKEEDCAGSEEEGGYTYVNRVEVTGVWRHYLGASTTVCFPGGTGRCVETCEVYDLKTGKRDDLKKYVDPAARAKLAELLNVQAKADALPEGYLPLNLKEAAICLRKDGIRIEFSNDSGSASTQITVARAEISRYFRLPADMANDAIVP